MTEIKNFRATFLNHGLFSEAFIERDYSFYKSPSFRQNMNSTFCWKNIFCGKLVSRLLFFFSFISWIFIEFMWAELLIKKKKLFTTRKRHCRWRLDMEYNSFIVYYARSKPHDHLSVQQFQCKCFDMSCITKCTTSTQSVSIFLTLTGTQKSNALCTSFN